MARNTLAPGGYIGGEPPRRPYFNQLSGVWKLEDVVERQKAGLWANPVGIEDLFSTWLYTGNGSTQTITNGIDLAGEGGMVWIKSRSGTTNHVLQDTERGADAWLSSNGPAAESTTAFNFVFNSDGFSQNNAFGVSNTLNDTYASWTFRKAPGFFDVVTWTGDGTTNRNISHSLGAVPAVIIIKSTSSATYSWGVRFYVPGSVDSTGLALNNTAPQQNVGFGLTGLSSTTFNPYYIAGNDGTNSNYGSNAYNLNGQTYVAYLFAHDAGGFGDSGNESVIKCGSFTVSSNQASINLGWEPQFLLIKDSASLGGWIIFDNMRGMSHGSTSLNLYANLSNAEGAFSNVRPSATGVTFDALSNSTYIYIAIRRGPMKTPEDATKVFDVDATRSAAPLPYNAGFPVDMFIQGTKPSNSQKAFFLSRLTGSQALTTNTTDAEVVSSFTFDSSIGILSGGASASSDHVGWMFRRAPGFFDVVAYTGTGSATTISHNLGVAPELMIVKTRSAVFSWVVYSAATTALEYLVLNSSALSQVDSTAWNNTEPSTTTFTAGSAISASSTTYIAYLFATLPGISKVGSYTGTGTTLNVDCGFTSGARLVIIKRTDSNGDWYVWDTARGIVAGNDPYLLLNSTAAENTSTDYIDPYSGGFEISSTAPDSINASGGSFIYLAIA